MGLEVVVCGIGFFCRIRFNYNFNTSKSKSNMKIIAKIIFIFASSHGLAMDAGKDAGTRGR